MLAFRGLAGARYKPRRPRLRSAIEDGSGMAANVDESVFDFLHGCGWPLRYFIFDSRLFQGAALHRNPRFFALMRSREIKRQMKNSVELYLRSVRRSLPNTPWIQATRQGIPHAHMDGGNDRRSCRWRRKFARYNLLQFVHKGHIFIIC